MEKKILAFTNLFPRAWEPNRATFNRQQFSEISKHFHVEVLVPVAWTDMLVAWKKNVLEMNPKNWDGITATYFPYFFIPRLARWSYGVTMFMSSTIVLPKLLGRQRPDMIYATWAYPDAFAAICLGRLLNIPVVVKIHGSDINEQPNYMGVGKMISWCLSQAGGIVSVSHDLAKKVIDLGVDKSRVKVIYNGLDASLFYPMEKQKCRETLKINKDASIILYVGNLKEKKGCLDLFDAFAKFKQNDRRIELVYIGGGACEQTIKAKTKQHNLEGLVHLIGQQKHDVLPLWMGAADLVVLPSYAEGVPNVLLEAMACARPVVASNVGGIPEVVPNTCGILVSPADSVQLYNAMDQALKQSWNIDALVSNAAQFSWEKNAKSISTLFLQQIPDKNGRFSHNDN